MVVIHPKKKKPWICPKTNRSYILTCLETMSNHLMTGRTKHIAERAPCFHFCWDLAFSSNKHHQYFPPLYEVHVGNTQRDFLWYMIYNIFGLASHIKHCLDDYFVREKHCKRTNSLCQWYFVMSDSSVTAVAKEATNKSGNSAFYLLMWCSDEDLVNQKLGLKVNFITDLSVQKSQNLYSSI